MPRGRPSTCECAQWQTLRALLAGDGFRSAVKVCDRVSCLLAPWFTAELGKATGDAVLEGWGQLLLANEVTAARKYTQAYAGNDVYRQVSVC